jgi:hypothetical protein
MMIQVAGLVTLRLTSSQVMSLKALSTSLVPTFTVTVLPEMEPLRLVTEAPGDTEKVYW